MVDSSESKWEILNFNFNLFPLIFRLVQNKRNDHHKKATVKHR